MPRPDFSLKVVARYLDTHLEDVICVLSLAVVAGSVILQVVLRLVFSNAVPWFEETAIIGMIFAVYFGASYAIIHKAHIRIISFIGLFPRPIYLALHMLADFLTFLFFLTMTWLTGDLVIQLSGMMQILPGLGVDLFWFQIFMPIALGLTALRIIQAYIRWVRSGCEGVPM